MADNREVRDSPYEPDAPQPGAPGSGTRPDGDDRPRVTAPDAEVTSTFDVREAAGRRDLTGERSAPQQAATRVYPPGDPATSREHGASAASRRRSRAGGHVGSLVLSLLLTPLAWYLVADAGARLTLAPNNPWESGERNVAALLELGGGLVVLAVALLAALWSSLGPIVTGVLVLVVGVPFVAVPQWTQQTLGSTLAWLRDRGDFGGNVAHHLVASGSTGRLVAYGLALVLLGVVSHGARRRGRREVRPMGGNA